MHTGREYAEQAKNPKYDKIKYSEKDCQAFCELVLKDIGIRKPDGKPYDWRGSNDMWRNAVSWRGTIDECKKAFGEIPLGAWVFMVAHDGGEIARGYHDNMGNASHIGIYVGDNQTRDSTKGSKRDGVAYRPLKDWTHIGLCKLLDYNTKNNMIEIGSNEIQEIIDLLSEINNRLKGWMENET